MGVKLFLEDVREVAFDVLATSGMEILRGTTTLAAWGASLFVAVVTGETRVSSRSISKLIMLRNKNFPLIAPPLSPLPCCCKRVRSPHDRSPGMVLSPILRKTLCNCEITVVNNHDGDWILVDALSSMWDVDELKEEDSQ